MSSKRCWLTKGRFWRCSPSFHQTANKYGFAIMVDETVGSIVNVEVLQYTDIVVSSLTKIFSGDANVMG